MYLVIWEIDIEADSAEDAARKAKEIQQDPESIANVFKVIYSDGTIKKIDLDDLED